jgi:hypothetical protein
MLPAKGIGFYLAAQMIAATGGAIRAESEGRGKGTTFFRVTKLISNFRLKSGKILSDNPILPQYVINISISCQKTEAV